MTGTNELRMTTIYVIDSEWKDFIKNAKREGFKNGSDCVRFLMRRFNQSRNPGLKLTVFMDEKAESPMNVICNFLEGATDQGQVYCRKKGSIWIQGINCYSCPNNKLGGSRKL